MYPILGGPGVSVETLTSYREVMRGGVPAYWPGGGKIDGSKSRDPDNSAANILLLRGGLPMGKITSGGKWAPSILGVTQGAYTSGGTTLTVTVAQAVEIARRVGSSGTGTLNAIGPPTAGGTVAKTAITFSAVNTSNGQITVTSLGVDKIAGTFITAADGTETPKSFIGPGMGILCDADGRAIPWPNIPFAGVVQVDWIVNYPTDSSLKTWLKAALSTTAGAKFVFSDEM